MAERVTVDNTTPQSVESDVKAEWSWNGESIKGTAKTLYHGPTNIHGGRLTFEEIPELGNAPMMSSGGSWVCWKSCVFSRAEGGSVNLFDIMGLPFHVEIESTSVDEHGTIIGQMKQTGKLEQVSPGKLRGETFIDAKYDGPKNVTWSPGYAVWLRQAGPGRIDAVYGQTMIHKHGSFFNIARRHYSYYSGRILPFETVWHYKLLSVDSQVQDGNQIWDYTGTAYYSPAEAETGNFKEFSSVLESVIEGASAEVQSPSRI